MIELSPSPWQALEEGSEPQQLGSIDLKWGKRVELVKKIRSNQVLEDPAKT